MKNETVTLSRELALQAANRLSDLGQCRISEPMFAALLAEPVPPAGGEPEVVATIVATGGPHDSEDRVLAEQQAELPPVGTELVDRAHVTRLQAEVERLTAGSKLLIGDLERRDGTVEALQAELRVTKQALNSLKGERDALQAELTKARELLGRILKTGVLSFEGEPSQEQTQLECDVCSYLANRSAPAAKDDK